MKTANGRSFVTRMTTDTSKFNLKGAIKELDELNKSLINNQYQQKAANKTINSAKKELEEIKKTIAETGKEDEKQTARIKELNDVLEKEKLKLAQLRSEQSVLRQAISETGKEVANSKEGWTVLKGVLSDLTSNVIEKLSGKLIELGKDIIQTGEQFSASMAEVGAISGANASELEKLTDAAREYGATTKFSASEVAQALKYMALAGWDSDQSISALGGILDLAAASGLDLARASDMVTDYLSAFGMEAKNSAYMADLLTFAQSNSNTSAQQLGDAWGNCAANMHAAGQDIETTTSMLEAMANQGLKGSEAGTVLAAIMRDITNKMSDGSITIGDTAVKVADAEGNFRDLTDIMADVEKAVDGMGTAEKSAALSSTFTAHSIKGVNLVLNESVENISSYEEALKESTGSASTAAKTMSDNLTGDLKVLDSAFEDWKLSVFENAEAPLRSIVQFITEKGVPALKALTDNIDKVIVVASAAASAIAGYKAAVAIEPVIKSAIKYLKEFDGTEKELVITQKMLNAAQKANGFGLLVGAITLAIGALTAYNLTAGMAETATKKFNDAMKSIGDSADSSIAKIQAETTSAKLLAEEYDTLKSKASLTADEKERLDTLAQQLATHLGTTVESIKNEEGAYSDLNTAIEENNKKLIENAKLQAYQDMLAEAIKTKTQLEKQLEKGVGGSQADDIQRAYNEASAAIDEYTEKLRDWGKETTETEEQLARINKRISELEPLENSDRTGATSSELEELRKISADLTAQLDDEAEKAEKASESHDKFNGSQKDNTKSTQELEAATATLADSLSELEKEASAAKSSMSELASAYKTVSQGQKLDLATLISLSEKYPEYAEALLQARDSAEEQAKVISKLFDVKKQEYIISLQTARDKIKASDDETKAIIENAQKQIEAYTSVIRVMVALGVVSKDVAAAGFNVIDNKMSDFEKTHAENLQKIAQYTAQINAIANGADISSFTGSGSSGSGGSSSDSNQYRTHGSGVEAFGKTQAESYIKWIDRMKQLGKMSVQSEIENYEAVVKKFQLTSDEKYDIDLRLYQARQKLAQEHEKQISDKVKLAGDAYKKLIEDRISLYQKQAEAAKDAADEEIAALDALKKKRSEDEDDAKRKAELDKVNARLKYAHLEEIERLELERKRQDLLNEQANVNFDRQIEAKKEALRSGADAATEKSNQAIEGLNSLMRRLELFMAQQTGSVSNQQIVNNNTRNQNVSIINQGLSSAQLRREMMDLLLD